MSSHAANERLVFPHVNCDVVSTGCLANLGVMRVPTKDAIILRKGSKSRPAGSIFRSPLRGSAMSPSRENSG
jgi:hypothetical protein